MSRIFGLFMLLPIYFLLMLVLFTGTIMSLENQSVEEFRLKKVMNYCIDAATDEMLTSGDLGMDYASWGKLSVDPELAADTYAATFCMNYKILANQANKELVQLAYTKLFVVCAYDGYYVYEAQQIDADGTNKFVSTPKLPYKTKIGNDHYAFNLGLVDCWRFTSANRLQKVKCPISEKEVLKLINQQVSDDFAYRLDQQYEQGWTRSLYLPFEVTTMSSTNPINRPSVLAIVDDVDLTSAKQISAFGVGGAHITQARAVAAYTRNGNKYYSYADLLPKDVFTATNPDGTKTFIENMYMTCEEAAKAGYHHDSLYMN